MAKHTSFRLGGPTDRQLDWLAKRYGNKTTARVKAVDRLYNQEQGGIMSKHWTLRLTISSADEMPRALWDGLEGFPFDDNGEPPDGNTWLPSVPLDRQDAGVQAIIDAGYGEMIEAIFGDAEALLKHVCDWPDDPASQPLHDWLHEASDEEIAEEAWNFAQQWQYHCRYGGGDVIIVANDA